MSMNYSDLINVPSFWKKRESTFCEERWQVSFWCKDCKKIVSVEKLPPLVVDKKTKEYMYKCKICNGQNIAIGTEAGLLSHFERK